MRMSASQFKDWKQKAITLLGMSGVGKTVLANKLRHENWYHYSGDYRIGSRYLDEPIMDNVKKHAMTVPLLRQLLRSDSITLVKQDHLRKPKTPEHFFGQTRQHGFRRVAVR